MSASHFLAKQKRRLSILFSVSIFAIIIVLDIAFLSFKYFDYQRQELGQLRFQLQGITKILSENINLEYDLLHGKITSMPKGIRRDVIGTATKGGRQGERRGIQIENFFLYSTTDGKILFSPKKDDELYGSILEKIQKETREGQIAFDFNNSEYFFLNSPINKTIGAVVFSESRMSLGSVLIDIFTYLLGAIFLSLGVYFASSRFIDHTLSPVEKNMDAMEQFIHNAGHELKTPISVIKSSLELMRLKKNYDEGITESIGELKRMNDLIQALIGLSTIEESSTVELIHVGELWQKLQKNYGEKMEAKNITLTITEKRPLNIRANKDYTEIFLSNLLSNAIKYNRENGDITVVIDQKSVTIQDTGIGIAKENLEKIFDRFYREDDVRMEESFGIGLSLVQRIAHIYKWTISVESEKGNGTKIKIQF